MPAWAKFLLIAALLALLVVAYLGYAQPGLLLDFANLRYCG